MLCINIVHIFIYSYSPSFIFRQPRSSSTSLNIFLRPFEMNVWFALIGLMLLSILIYYTINHFESNEECILKTLSDVILLKISTLCQQGNFYLFTICFFRILRHVFDFVQR